MRILLVEDERELSNALVAILTRSNYSVDPVYDGEDALYYLETENYDAVILDIMIPKIDGIEVLKTIRKEGNKIPVIMLTAKSEIDDRVVGLDSGADDYLTKPFNPLELVARVKSQLRRYKKLGNMSVPESQKVVVGDLEIDDETKEVTIAGELIKLTPIEYNILLLLAKNAGKVFSIDEIYEQIWNEEAIGADNTVAVHIRHIREKIELNPKEPRYLKVVWGVGYKIEKQS